MLLTRAAGTSMLAALATALLSTSALAHRGMTPLPGQATHVGPYAPPYVAPPKVNSGNWAPLQNMPPVTSFPDTPALLTDGTVILHDGCTSDWYRLTPNRKGSYLKG